jgi:chromosome segregation ATPase
MAQIANSITEDNSSLSDVDPTTSTKITEIQKTISNLQLLVQSVNSGTNLFKDVSDAYYKQYEDYNNNLQKQSDQASYKNSYLLSTKQSIDSSQNILVQLQATTSDSNAKTSAIIQTISNLQMLLNSINNNTNYFSQSNIEYYNKFLDYKNNVSELQNSIDSKSKAISSLQAKKASIIDDYNSQLSSAQKVIDQAEIDLSKYENQSSMDIKSKLDDANKATEKLQAQLEQDKLTPELDNINKQLTSNDITKYKMDSLVQLDDGIKEDQQKIDGLKTNIASLQLNIDKSTVKAPIDGVINVKNDITKTELIKSGQEILSVIPESSSQYKVKLYVSNKDIAGMKVGEKIKYHFQALPYKEYGELTGKITDIAVDSTVDQQSGASYYLVESEIQNKPLLSYKGEKGELKMGMACEAQVIIKRKKILFYLLEKINLTNK